MYYYIRKVEKKLWDGKESLDSVSISDLSTEDNDISVWIDDDSPDEYKRLALAFILQTPKISDLYCLRIPDSAIQEKSLKFNPIPSITPYITKRALHTNISVPSIWEIGSLAEIMHDLISAGVITYVSEQELKELFYEAIKNNEIEIDFNERRYKSFRKALADIEKQKVPIDFTVSDKAKEVVPDTKRTCPICKGQGKVSLEKYTELVNKGMAKAKR